MLLSADGGNALVRAEEISGGGPAVDDPHHVSSGATHDACWCVPQAPTQPFRFRGDELTVQHSCWNQQTRSAARQTSCYPGAVGVKVAERESLEPRVLQPFDVVLDVSVVTHVRVQLDGGAGVVGVVTPVAVTQRREQRPLRALVEVFAANDQPGPCRLLSRRIQAGATQPRALGHPPLRGQGDP